MSEQHHQHIPCNMSEFIETEWSGRHLQKDRIRHEVWSRLQQAQVVQHDPFGHIPNFVDAQQAADRLATLPCWQQASVIKCNPDKP
jgi:5-formyltetrahydrofolate cyclo-ligase